MSAGASNGTHATAGDEKQAANGLDDLRQRIVQGTVHRQSEEEDCVAEEPNIDQVKWHIMQAILKMKGSGNAARGGHPDGPAHVWHARRRAQLMQIPEVKELLREGGVGHPKELTFNCALLLLVIVLHVAVCQAIARYAADASYSGTALAVLVASATVGASFSNCIQALNHEIGHGCVRVDIISFTGRRIVYLSCFALGQLGAALCHVPWTSYYMGGGHARHHKYTGSARDVDEDALFTLYQPQFPGFFKRLAWLSVASVAVPFLMFISLVRCAMFDWRSNYKELTLVSVDISLTFYGFYIFGRAGAAYLLLSSWFSMGFLCHPLVLFWILQHLCVGEGGTQPTTSYYGSWIWNTLCVNELLHVEHHDIAGIAWRHTPKLRELAPDMYKPLYAEMSVWGLIAAWASAGSPGGDKRFAWDFACRTEWGYTRADAARQAQAAATANALVKQYGTSLASKRPFPQTGASLPHGRARLRRPAGPAQGNYPEDNSPDDYDEDGNHSL